MKGIIRRFFVLVTVVSVLCSMGIVVNAASTDYSVKVQGKSISFLKGGQAVGTHTSRDGNITIVTAPAGTLGLCYHTTDNRYVRVNLGNQTSLDITGTISTLTLDKSLNPSVKVTLGSSANVTTMAIKSKNNVTIGGKISTLTISSGAQVSVVAGAKITTAKVSSSQAKLTAASGSTVNKVSSVPGASVSGKGIKSSSSTSSSRSSSSSKTTTKNVTLSAESGDRLRDLWQSLNSKVRIYDDNGTRILGSAEWDNSDTTVVRNGNTYDYTFYPNSSQYDEVSGTATIKIDDDDDKSSSKSSSEEERNTLWLDVATIYSRASSARLRDVEDYLDEAVVAYDKKDRQISGRSEWISDTSTSVRSGQSYSFIFVPNDSFYESARGTVKIELNSKSSGVGGGEITLASFTLEADYREYLYDLKSELQSNVRAYNSNGNRVNGTAKWISSDTRLTVTGTYRYEFIPDNDRYETAKGDIKIYVSGSGSHQGSSSNNSSNNSNNNSSSSTTSSTITLKVDTITVNSTNNTLRDLLSDLRDAVTAKNRDGDTVDGTVKWVDNNTSQKVRRTGDYRFKFIPDSSRYDEKQDWITIKVK